MNRKILGNTLTPEKIRLLVNIDNIIIKFSPFKESTDFSKIIENKLRKKFGTNGLEPDYGGNKFRFEGNKLRCRSHDCGDTLCQGLGETYHVSGEELQKIANN
jgi:hypothetical protein